MSDLIIQPLPPQDGRDYDCQCAWCGSSCESRRCDQCGCDGFIFDDQSYDDCVTEEVAITCPDCGGCPVTYHCISSREWCEANPLPGRENVERGAIQWFEISTGEDGY